MSLDNCLRFILFHLFQYGSTKEMEYSHPANLSFTMINIDDLTEMSIKLWPRWIEVKEYHLIQFWREKTEIN